METGQTKFLRDILIPTYGPSSIPDDKVRRHVLRQEPITFNIKANSTGKGAFILFPNNPGSVIGAHLHYNNDTNRYVYNQSITAAQNLRKSYNLARQTGFVLTIRSSTLPSGVYALSGTFNAATYEGPPSELSDGMSLIPDYGSLLQVTANPQDKIGNVKVGEGITVLGLPVSWDQPYTRLSDEVASSDGSGGAYVIDDTMSLNYTCGKGYYKMENSGSVATAFTEVTRFNFDSNQQSIMDAHLSIKPTMKEPSKNIYDFTVGVTLSLVGLDGSRIKESDVRRRLTFRIQPSGKADRKYVDIDTVYPAPGQIDTQFVAGAVSISVDVETRITAPDGSMTTGEDGTPWVVEFDEITVNAKSVNGNLPGVTSPTSVVLYEGMPEGATLTGTGVKNYELIPNQDLLRNVQTMYPKMDPRGLAYAKAVFAHRGDLQIRSVWATPDYEARFNLFNEISMISVTNIPVEETQAMAWGFGDVIRAVRKFVPVLSNVADTLIPGSGAVLRGAESVAQHFLGDAASGSLLRSSAAGGKLLGPSRPMSAIMFGRNSYAAEGDIPRLRGNGAALFQSDKALLRQNGLTRKEQTAIAINTTDPNTPKYAIIFPTIVTTNTPFHDRQITGTQLYAVIPGDHRGALDIIGSYKNGSLIIHGIINPGDWAEHPTGEYTVVPIRRIMGNVLVIDPTAPLPRGSSMQLALTLAASDKLQGLVPVAYTGSVQDGKVQPNQWSHIKKLGMTGFNIPLASNDSSSDLRVRSIEEAISLGSSYQMDYDRVHNFPKHEGKFSHAADWADRLADLFEEAAAMNPRFAKLRDVVEFIGRVDDSDNTILDGLWSYVQADPQGSRFRNLVVNSLAPTKAKGRTNVDAMRARAEGIADRLMQQGYPVDANWIMRNGNRGLSSEQVQFFAQNGRLPEPTGITRVVAPPENPQEAAEKVYQNSFANAKKIPESSKPIILEELMEIARKRGITDTDTRAITAKYTVKGTDHLLPRTRAPRLAKFGRLAGLDPSPPIASPANRLGEEDDQMPPPPPPAPRTSVISRTSRFRIPQGEELE